MNALIIYTIAGALTARRYYFYTLKVNDPEREAFSKRYVWYRPLSLSLIGLFWLPLEFYHLWEETKKEAK